MQPRSLHFPALHLHPADIPFQAQYRILTDLQLRLERCGFKFAQTWLPRVCQLKRWDCPEKVELHSLVRILEYESRENFTSAFQQAPVDALPRMRRDIVGIRHAAVHRQPQARRHLLQKLDSAINFAEWLGDWNCGLEIQRCRVLLRSLLDDMDERSRLLTSRFITHRSRSSQQQKKKQQLLLEAVRRITHQNACEFIQHVERILRDTFCQTYSNENK